MIALLRGLLRRGFELIERPFERLYGPALNPLSQLGALGFFFFWVVAVSGIYLFIFFDTGIERAYESVEYITHEQWFHAGVMRSFHRYASDLMVVMVVTHVLREFAYDRYRGARWFSWLTGLPIIWLLYISGITGYWLVWDRLAHYVALTTSELLDYLPIFGEPIARNFISTGTLTSRFFTLMVFMHVAVPLFLLFLMWVHILRISRPKVNPPRALALMTLLALIAVSIYKPALSQGHVDLARAPVEAGLDWFYLPLYPLVDFWGKGGVWAALAVFFVVLGAMPWLPPFRRARAAAVDLAHCNGCARCADDCPYEAIRMVRRTDGLPFPTEAQVDPSLCVSCGICMGACPSSTPFRRAEDLKTGIDLPDYSLTELRRRTIAAAAGLTGDRRVLVFACDHGGGASHDAGTVRLPCVAMAPPSLIDYVLSRDLADGVVIAGCSESACYHRSGVEWMKQRVAAMRDPYLRARVPRERIAMIWTSALERGRFLRKATAFAARLRTEAAADAAQAVPADRGDGDDAMMGLRYAGMFALILALFAGVAALADWPVYRQTPRDTAVVMLSFVHGAARADCRRLTPAEIAKLPPNMRRVQDCPRERRSIRVEFDIDGKTVLARDLKPTGIAGDGPSKVYERFVAPVGDHDILVRMRDTARADGFDHERRQRVTLRADQMLVIDFRAETNDFVIR